MTPSEQIIKQSTQLVELKDASGRSIKVRHLTALDTLRLLKVAGPQLAHNLPWLSLATIAYAVTELDNVPVPVPTTEAQIEALVERLGEHALSVIADHLEGMPHPQPSVDIESAGN